MIVCQNHKSDSFIFFQEVEVTILYYARLTKQNALIGWSSLIMYY